MKRRIKLNGVSLNAVARAKEAERDRLRDRFAADPAMLSKFIDYIVRSGWDEASISSVVNQSHNFERPPMQVFLQGGGTLLDQVLLNQGTYTHMQDTAADPNFAVRFKSETETILRRLTPGDLMMLDAAHRVHAMYPNMHEESDSYWRCVWQALYFAFYPDPLTVGRVHQHEHLHDDPWLAVSASVEAYLRSPEASRYDLNLTFFDRDSLFYVGVMMQFERLRLPLSDSYVSTNNFHHVDREESLWFAATVLTAYAVDNYARDWTAYETQVSPWFRYIDPVKATWSRCLPMPYTKCEIGTPHANLPQN